jgi:peptidyl-prolyl cis-trans isomerase C
MKCIIFIALICSTLLSCSLFESKGEVVAQVGDEKLTMEEFKANFSTSEWVSLSSEQKKEYVQQWVNLVLLAQEAEKLGLEKDKAVKNRIRYAEQKILGNALIISRLDAEKISEEEMFNYYRIHQGDFTRPMMNYKVQRIYLTDPNLVNKVKTEITNGMKFEDAARVYSQEELAKNGGFMGIVSPDGADSLFWQALNKVKIYEITTLQKDNGYYIIRNIQEEQGIGESGFEGQKDEIRRRILDERRKQVYDDLLRELRSRSDIYLMI